MRFLLDENVDIRVATFLEDRGHDVTAVARDYQRSLPDAEVLALAVREERIVITQDRDFGELVYRQQHAHAGVIYLRVQPPDIQLILGRLEALLQQPEERFSRFLVVTRTRIREGRARR